MGQCRLTDFTNNYNACMYNCPFHGEVLVVLWDGGGTGVGRVVGTDVGGGIMKG